MQHQEVEVEGVANGAPHLEVDEERLWRDVGVERLWVPAFSHPCILNDDEDKLRSLAPRRLNHQLLHCRLRHVLVQKTPRHCALCKLPLAE